MKKGDLDLGHSGLRPAGVRLHQNADMGSSSTSALNSAPCDAGADATCPQVTPDPTPTGGW